MNQTNMINTASETDKSSSLYYMYSQDLIPLLCDYYSTCLMSYDKLTEWNRLDGNSCLYKS